MSLNHDKLDWRRWAKVRRAVFERDSYRCTRCGRPGRLEAHHEPPLRAGGDPYDVAGVLAMCKSCHIEHHRQETDDTPGRAAWREFLGTMV